MRQVVGIVAAALAAAVGAVVLGEYELVGMTAVFGFLVYGLVVVEVALAVARRLSPPALAAVAVLVAGGLVWALWIANGHFRAGQRPPALTWALVPAAAAASVAWGRSSGERRTATPLTEPSRERSSEEHA